VNLSTTRLARGPLALLTVAVLTSCTATAFEPPELQRPQREGDALPASVLDTAGVAPDSSRLVGPWESSQVYLARSNQQDKSTCLVVVGGQDAADWASSCLSAGGYIEMSLAGQRYLLGESAGGGSDEEWTELAEGVYARP